MASTTATATPTSLTVLGGGERPGSYGNAESGHDLHHPHPPSDLYMSAVMAASHGHHGHNHHGHAHQSPYYPTHQSSSPSHHAHKSQYFPSATLYPGGQYGGHFDMIPPAPAAADFSPNSDYEYPTHSSGHHHAPHYNNSSHYSSSSPVSPSSRLHNPYPTLEGAGSSSVAAPNDQPAGAAFPSPLPYSVTATATTAEPHHLNLVHKRSGGKQSGAGSGAGAGAGTGVVGGSNKKERRRTQSINNAYANLRECIPNVPCDTKLSKIKTLRLATSYIDYLMTLLNSDNPDAFGDGFKAEIHKKWNEKSEEQKRIELEAELNNNEGALRLRSNKGGNRTGWPQHVWALELKQ